MSTDIEFFVVIVALGLFGPTAIIEVLKHIKKFSYTWMLLHVVGAPIQYGAFRLAQAEGLSPYMTILLPLLALALDVWGSYVEFRSFRKKFGHLGLKKSMSFMRFTTFVRIIADIIAAGAILATLNRWI